MYLLIDYILNKESYFKDIVQKTSRLSKNIDTQSNIRLIALVSIEMLIPSLKSSHSAANFLALSTIKPCFQPLSPP